MNTQQKYADRGRARGVTIVHVIAGIMTVGTMLWAGVASFSTMNASAMTLPTDSELAVVLTRVGLDAETLAAAGATGPQAQSVVAAVRSHLAEGWDVIRTGEESLRVAQAEHDRLERLVQAGAGTQQDVAALAVARTTLANARTLLAEALEDAFDAGADNLNSETQRPVVEAIRASRAAGWDLPPQYLAVSRGQSNWVNLRDALANERIAAKLGEEPDPGCHQAVLAEDGVAAVANAKANLDARLSTVEAAWNSAVYD